MSFVPEHFELLEVYKYWTLYYDNMHIHPYVGYSSYPVDAQTMSFDSLEELKAFIDNLPPLPPPPTTDPLPIIGGIIVAGCVAAAGLYWWFTKK